MDILKKLEEKNELVFSQEQLEILNHVSGPASIHSTAGSGKTTMICTKIALLINDYNVEPTKILVLSYSNASVQDISNRFEELMIGKIHAEIIKKIKFSTIHSFAMSIINYYSRKTGIRYKIAGSKGENSVNSIISSIFEEIYNRQPQISELERITNSMSLLNNRLINNSENPINKSNIDNLTYIYNKYQQFKQDKGIIDFDDMVILAIKILRENLVMKDYYKRLYDYILVDEAQDMSKLQYELLKLIVNDYQSITILGDSDQSIYNFRGSYKEIFNDFTRDFKNQKNYMLEINYRCPANLVNISKEFIELSGNRMNKEIRAFKKENGFVKILDFNSDDEQIEFVINEISDKYMNDLDNTIILFRDSLSSVKLICALINKEIGFYSNISEYRLFKHFTKNDIIASIWLSFDRTLLIALFQFYNKLGPDLNLNKGDIIRLRDNQNENEDIFNCFRRIEGFTNEKRRLMDELELNLDNLSKLKPYDAIEYFLNEMNYKKYLISLTKGIEYEKSIYFRYIEIMRSLTKNEPSIKTYINWVARLQLRIQESLSNKGKNSITLSTLHSAKGLEYNNVFIIDMNDRIIPSGDSDIEEERRLAFVGMTRAKKNLYMLSSGNKSPFLNEIESILK